MGRITALRPLKSKTWCREYRINFEVHTNWNLFETRAYICILIFSKLPATTVSARDKRCKTCSMRLTSVHACRFRTLFLKIAINTLHISAWNEEKTNFLSVFLQLKLLSAKIPFYNKYQGNILIRYYILNIKYYICISSDKAAKTNKWSKQIIG